MGRNNAGTATRCGPPIRNRSAHPALVVARAKEGRPPVHEPPVATRSYRRASARGTPSSIEPARATRIDGARSNAGVAGTDQSTLSIQHTQRACKPDYHES